MVITETSCVNKSSFSCSAPVIGQGPPLPRGRGGHAAGILNGRVFVVGGSDWSSDHTQKFWLSDSIYFTDNHWENGPVLPHPLAYSMFAHDSTGIYLAGGMDGANNLRTVYHLANIQGTWKTLTQLPTAMASGSGALLNGKLYVACGWTDEGITNKMWSLDLNQSDANWQECQILPGPQRAFPALTACGNYLYLFGGMGTDSNGSQIIMQDAYKYSPEKNQWTRLKDLPWKGYAWSGAALDSDHIILAGKADGQIYKDIYLIDVMEMNTKKIGKTVIQTTTAPLIKVASNEFWLIAGEPDSNKNRTNIVTSIQFNYTN